jgi:hypothetical protein
MGPLDALCWPVEMTTRLPEVVGFNEVRGRIGAVDWEGAK